MNKWPLDVKYHPTRQILSAVTDPKWQEFRLSLKGLSTPEKLSRLRGYLLAPNVTDTEYDRRRIRVDNYINALKRGGQLNKYGEVQR